MKTIIINGGNIEDDFALPFLQKEQYDYLIAVDKGLEFCYRAGIRPDEMLGDFDSAAAAVRDYFEGLKIPVQLYKPEKDQTDMENAMQNGMNRKLQDGKYRLSVYLERFAGLSPLKKLNQGYSYVSDKNKKTLTSVEQVQNGDTIYISVTDGTIEADVTGTVKEERIYGEERKL